MEAVLERTKERHRSLNTFYLLVVILTSVISGCGESTEESGAIATESQPCVESFKLASGLSTTTSGIRIGETAPEYIAVCKIQRESSGKILRREIVVNRDRWFSTDLTP